MCNHVLLATNLNLQKLFCKGCCHFCSREKPKLIKTYQ